MVFDQNGNVIKQFTGTAIQDPNCSAFMQDGSLFVANRLGGTAGGAGAVSKFDANDDYRFDFTTPGIASLMAVARDPNAMSSGIDDTLWVTSGGGDTGIYQFDQNGNLLTSILPADIDDGRPVVPQGIAFDSNGDFMVVSFLNEVIKFDDDGNYLMRFPTGPGTARSTAFQGCRTDVDTSQGCVPLGVDTANVSTGITETANTDIAKDNTVLPETEGTNNMTVSSTVSSSSGGGANDLLFLTFCFFVVIFRHLRVLKQHAWNA